MLLHPTEDESIGRAIDPDYVPWLGQWPSGGSLAHLGCLCGWRNMRSAGEMSGFVRGMSRQLIL